jgi:hypothetical protein
MEKPFVLPPVRTEVKTDACSTSRVASNNHMVWVSSELGYVLLNPFESLSLVMKTKIGFDANTVVEESVDANAIVDADNNHIQITSLDEARSINVRVGIRVEATSLNVEINWKPVFA